ncbi:sugar transferase [Devosia sp. Leaf64]|uniref:sugar transferase n=1 Tax=Devosia sp. Leaf64 TaxID=1736229 RepID=UPI000A5DF96E|nr:sugar transferase [Devosia sp. Leaf64]
MKNDDIVYTAQLSLTQKSLHNVLGTRQPQNTLNFLMTKRIVDIFLSLILIVLLAPLMLILAALVRLDGSPAIYGQKRLGQHGLRFTLWKLRTMSPDAEHALAAYLASDAKAGEEWRANQKLRRDPRITLIGRLLRKYSLDELPQLFNVLHGDMSLIGPRPMMVDQESLYPGLVYAGLRPGLTGLWQVSRGDDATFAARAHFDAAYAATLSWRSDLKIAVTTIGYLFAGRGC